MNIASIQVAISFKQQDDILYLLGQEIIEFQKRHNAQKQPTNLPMASPPDAPRVSIFAPNFVLNIALNRIDIFANIPPNVSNDSKTSLSYVQNIVKEAHDIFAKKIEYQWLGLVLNVVFSRKNLVKTPLEAVLPVYDVMINVPRKNRDLASFNCNFGFSEYPFFVIYTICGYENFEFSFPLPNNNVPVVINDDKKRMIDTGISVVLDINNKQALGKSINLLNDFDLTAEKCDALLLSMLDDLNLSKVLGNGGL
ncbi:hypothetical protein AGMMS49940_14220 [Spirochaetia bacterium]|nr:hypothetical protein AGMMS49940_14220 [Spirochaetia bacterium]